MSVGEITLESNFLPNNKFMFGNNSIPSQSPERVRRMPITRSSSNLLNQDASFTQIAQ